MLERLARFTISRRRLVLVVVVVLFAAAGAYGTGAADSLTSGGFDDPSSESQRASRVLEEQFGSGSLNFVLLVTVDDGSVDDPSIVASGTDLTERLAAEPGVANVSSYWSLGSVPQLRNEDATRALVIGRIVGDEDRILAVIDDLSERYRTDIEGARVEVGGLTEVFREVGETVREDLVRAELIAVPITLLVLLLVFRSLVAAVLPLVIGGLAVVGTLALLRVLTEFTEVSIFALNLTTAMGLGLAIDYSLFIVSRFREELAAGRQTGPAVVRTVRTAGRTIAFSALTVAASLSALLIFPIAFLRSFAYAGSVVAILAGFCAVVVLPALLAVLGPRIDAISVRRRPPKPVEEGTWYRTAQLVMRHPLPVIVAVVAALLLLGAPFLNVNLGQPDDRVLYEGASSRAVSEVLRNEFDAREASGASIVAPDTSAVGTGPALERAIDDYASRLSEVDGVARVDTVTGIFVDGRKNLVPEALTDRFAAEQGTWMNVIPSVEPVSDDGERLVTVLRSVDAPFETLITGVSADLIDSKAAVFSRVPEAMGIIALVTFVLLFLMFGSVIVPLKALVMNVLSLTATFGAMVWIFQEGNLSGVLDFTATGSIDVSVPILTFCIAFGLSMDYEVFILSRIKEEHDTGRDNVTSVALGLERSGRIVTAAAALVAIVFIAFASSRVSFIKLSGVGLALAVLIDAFVIRGTLVPAFMRLAGDLNWWAPGPLRRLHDRFGISESVDLRDEDGQDDRDDQDEFERDVPRDRRKAVRSDIDSTT
jgi:RND superfamily putative drug exporter